MSKKSSSSSSSPPPSLDGRALFYMALLAIQFGIQPILTRTYAAPGINKSTVILMQEILKFALAFVMLHVSGARETALKGWNISTWISVAAIPAALYAVQNLAALKAYQNLDALTFNVLNQTKTLSAALCCYFVMGRSQSMVQIGALFLLLVSALVMEGIVPLPGLTSTTTSSSSDEERHWETRHLVNGVLPILVASFLSGLAGALSQQNLQKSGGGRNAYLFSMELCVASVVILTTSLAVSSDGRQLFEKGFWEGWTPLTFIPIFSNSVGGIIVGLVTKYAGSVRKGFALIFGILLSGVAQAVWQPETKIKPEQIAGGVLAAISLYLHATNPPLSSSSLTSNKTTKQE
mmetsp:Transcript_21272/g.40394  ORF Transcript_21272/g.40394 Transcript_21272/m.40394 type:complete len:349 (-) Transcript_21272:64-1110(-)